MLLTDSTVQVKETVENVQDFSIYLMRREWMKVVIIEEMKQKVTLLFGC